MSTSLCGCTLTNYYNEPLTLANSSSNVCTGSAIVIFMTILETLLQNSCKINDPCGRVVPRTAPDEEYDFIVVGGGSGGSVVAGRLAEVALEKNWKILLIEAGRDAPAYSQVPLFPRYTVGNSGIDWQFKTEEPVACLNTGGKCSWPRGKVLGGTGVLNGMMYLRATRKDAKRWVEAGNTDWTYQELLRLYKKSEDNRDIGTVVDSLYHSQGGPWTIQRFNYRQEDSVDVLKAAEQVGFNVLSDLNGEVNYGFGIFQANNRNGKRFTTAEAYLRPQRDNPNLHIMINSTVSKILIDKIYGQKRATGVVLTYNNQTYTVNATKEVILAAGTVQTPQILLLSGIGDKRELEKVGIKQVHNLRGVGKGLKDHIGLFMTYTTNQNASRLDWYTVTDYLSTEGGPMSAQTLHILGRFSSSYSTQDDPDGVFYSGTAGSWCDPPGSKTFQAVPSLNQARSTGYITLKTNNIADHPKIVANYYNNDTDLKMMVEFVRVTQKIVSSPVLQEKFGLKLLNQSYYNTCSGLFTYDSDSWWECVLRYGTATTYHPSSSCKMGPISNPDTCVNQRLQLHGIENIRITDASVFPTTISANLQATVVAVAEKGAESIIKKYCK